MRLPAHYGPLSPIVHAVRLQLLAYHTALAREMDVEEPCRLAKPATGARINPTALAGCRRLLIVLNNCHLDLFEGGCPEFCV